MLAHFFMSKPNFRSPHQKRSFEAALLLGSNHSSKKNYLFHYSPIWSRCLHMCTNYFLAVFLVTFHPFSRFLA